MLLMIDVMGIHNCEVVVGIKLFWEFYEKWMNWWFVIEWCFDFKFYMVLIAFLCL